MEPPTEKLEYESDNEDAEGLKTESRTTVLIKVVDDEGTPTTAVVQGMLRPVLGHQFDEKTLFQLYPLLDISTLQLLYINYLHEATQHWLK